MVLTSYVLLYMALEYLLNQTTVISNRIPVKEVFVYHMSSSIVARL